MPNEVTRQARVLKPVPNCWGGAGGPLFPNSSPNLSSEEAEQEGDTARQCCPSNWTKNRNCCQMCLSNGWQLGDGGGEEIATMIRNNGQRTHRTCGRVSAAASGQRPAAQASKELQTPLYCLKEGVKVLPADGGADLPPAGPGAPGPSLSSLQPHSPFALLPLSFLRYLTCQPFSFKFGDSGIFWRVP